MSSYLSFYLVPKKSAKKHNYNEEGKNIETEVKLSEGKPLLLMSFSRNNDIYQAYYEAMNPAYCGMEDKYTEVTYEDAQRVVKEFKEDITTTEKRLAINYKMLKECGYNSELWEEIQSTEKYIDEQKTSLMQLECIADIVYEVYKNFTDFEKVLINVD